MQTFIPFPDFEQSAKVLDRQRLGKQRVECKQILNALSGSSGWANHPAVKMWAGHEKALCRYAIAVCSEWRNRGYKDTMLPWFIEQSETYPDNGLPTWFGRKDIHDSHKANLTRKDASWYNQHWQVEPQEGYVWPVNDS